MVNAIENVEILVIGPETQSELWENVRNKSYGKIKNIAAVDYHSEYFLYINAADVVLDSWPYAGWTVALDAVSCGVPVLCLESPLGSSLFLKKAGAVYAKPTTLIEHTQKILSDARFKKALVEREQQEMVEENSAQTWKQRIQNLIAHTPKSHAVKKINSEQKNRSIKPYDICTYEIYAQISKTKEISSGLFRSEEREYLYFNYITFYFLEYCIYEAKFDAKTGEPKSFSWIAWLYICDTYTTYYTKIRNKLTNFPSKVYNKILLRLYNKLFK